MTDPSTITTVEELPEPLREELVAKRAAGTTLAELKKGYPQVAPDVIRAVLPPLPKGTEPKPAPRKPLAAKPPRRPPRASARPSRRPRRSPSPARTAARPTRSARHRRPGPRRPRWSASPLTPSWPSAP